MSKGEGCVTVRNGRTSAGVAAREVPRHPREGTMITRSPIPAGDQHTHPYDHDDEPALPLVDDGDPWEFFFDTEETKTAVAASSSQPMIV